MEIFKSFGSLQSELDQAKSYLKNVDENIKRLIGRDPSEAATPAPPSSKRGQPNGEVDRTRPQMISRGRNLGHENNDPSGKKRISVFQRLDGPIDEDVWLHPPKTLISKVIVTPREVPSRQEVLASRCTDEKSKARNKRMFGALLGTLQKFQQEETKLKSKEQKRARVEKKIEDLEIKEKEEIRRERQELFFSRRKKLVEIKILEIKMMRMREFATWEQRIRPRSNYICTKTKPRIKYLPRRLNDDTKALLAASKVDIEKLIEERKQEVVAELKRIEERILTNFEVRNQKDDPSNHHAKVKKDNDDHRSKHDLENDECEAEIQDIINGVTNEAAENYTHPVPEKNGLLEPTDEMNVDIVTTKADSNHTHEKDVESKALTIEENTYKDSKSRAEESD